MEKSEIHDIVHRTIEFLLALSLVMFGLTGVVADMARTSYTPLNGLEAIPFILLGLIAMHTAMKNTIRFRKAGLLLMSVAYTYLAIKLQLSGRASPAVMLPLLNGTMIAAVLRINLFIRGEVNE